MKKKLISILAVISFFGIINFTYAVSPEPIFFYDSGIGLTWSTNITNTAGTITVDDSFIKLVGDTTGDLTEDLNIDSNTFVVDFDGNNVGIGTAAPTTMFAVNGDQSCKKTNVADANYGTSAITTDYVVAWTSLSAAKTATISTEDEDSGTATLPRVMIFKDQTGSAASYNITISLESSGNIDGATTYVLNRPYQFVVLEIDGTNAWVIGGN